MITFALSMAGVKAGNVFGSRCRLRAHLCRGRNLNAYGGENPLRTSSGTWKDAYCEPMNSNEVWVRTAFYRFVSCKGKGLCVMMIHYGKGYSVRFYGITGRKRKGQKQKERQTKRKGTADYSMNDEWIDEIGILAKLELTGKERERGKEGCRRDAWIH